MVGAGFGSWAGASVQIGRPSDGTATARRRNGPKKRQREADGRRRVPPGAAAAHERGEEAGLHLRPYHDGLGCRGHVFCSYYYII